MPQDSTDKTLRISVVMCTYNGERYLREQMDSILRQTYPVEEIVVQDDGSTDGTMQILEEYAQHNPLVKVFSNDSGQHGINANFFSAMRRAKGDYIAISDQDDIWEVDKLRLQAEAIGNKMLCSGFSVPFSADGFPVQVDWRRPCLHLLRNCYLSEMPGHTMLMRRDLLDYLKEGEKIRLYYDWQIACVAAAAESVAFVEKKLVNFRRHSDAATATVPVGSGIISKGAWDYVKVSLFHHRFLQNELKERFTIVKPFLEQLPFDTPSLSAGVRMSELHLHKGPLWFFRRVAFFVKHSHHIFHTEERRSVVRVLRAMFFVYSCGYYYRSHLPQKDNK